MVLVMKGFLKGCIQPRDIVEDSVDEEIASIPRRNTQFFIQVSDRCSLLEIQVKLGHVFPTPNAGDGTV